MLSLGTPISDTTTYPNRATVKLFNRWGDDWFVASGSIINEWQVLTAAHTVYSAERGGFSNETFVFAGFNGYQNRDGATRLPFGLAKTTYRSVATSFTQSDEPANDLAVLTLDRPLGSNVGWYGWKSESESYFDNHGIVNTRGYPSESGDGFTLYGGAGTANYATNDWIDTQTASFVQVEPGSSGSPLYLFQNDERHVVGVLSRGDSTHGVWTRIDAGWANFIAQAKIDHPQPASKSDLVDYDWFFDSGLRWITADSNTSSISSTSATQGSPFTARARVYNNGTSAASGVKVSFYLSANEIISTSDTLLGSSNIAVGAHGSADANWTGAIPSGVAPGSYYVGWLIDSDDSINEYDYGGAAANQGHHATKVAVTAAAVTTDLRGYAFDASPEPLTPGAAFAVDFRVANYGQSAAGAFAVHFYLSANATITSSDRYLGAYQFSGLNGGAISVTDRRTFALPGASDTFWNASGVYYIGMLVDGANAVNETNESNNSSQGDSIDLDAVQITVGGGQIPQSPRTPDLVGRTSTGQWWVGHTTANGLDNRYFGYWSENALWRDVLSGDFDGDGDTDVIGRTAGGAWWIGRNTGGAFTNQVFGVWNEAAGWRDVMVADMNGDGRADIVGRTATGQWWVGQSNGATLVNQYFGFWRESADWRDVAVGDFNNDSRADVVGRTAEGQWWVGQNTGASFNNLLFGLWSGDAGWRDVMFADLNGDGRADALGRTATGQWWLGQSTGAGFVNFYVGNWSEPAGWRDVALGDFDNDGDADLVGRTSYGQWWIGRNTGGAFTNYFVGIWNEAALWRDVSLADFNGDGRVDVVGRTATGQWWLGESTGAVFTNRYFGFWNEAAGWRDVMTGAFQLQSAPETAAAQYKSDNGIALAVALAQRDANTPRAARQAIDDAIANDEYWLARS